jgi:hypothetical protein
MEAYMSADDYIKSFINEIEVMNENAVAQPLPTQKSSATAPTARKRRKRPSSLEAEAKKPGWVPKPADDCPIVSWMEGEDTFAVQNPGNNGQLLLKMELYDSTDMVFMCGLFLDKDSEMFKGVKQLVDKLENMWIDKSTGVPKTNGLTQTVTQRSKVSKPKNRTPRKKRVASSNN